MKIKQVLTRFYTQDMEGAIQFYETILNEKCSQKFHYEKMKLDLAQVGNLLILGGAEEALKPFRATQATFLVDSVREFKEHLLKNGSEIIRDIMEVPTGMNMTLRHPDGSIVEYVEHKTQG
jgi:predicted enzyme related to lactoylglutathione lyase